MQADKTSGLRRARLYHTMAMGCFVLAVVLHVLEANLVWGRREVWLACGAAGMIFALLFVVSAPVCRDCKLHFWNLVARSHVCCFMEKAALKTSLLRSFRLLGWFFLGAGLLVGLEPQIEGGVDRYARFLESKIQSDAERSLRAGLTAAEQAWLGDRTSLPATLALVDLLVHTSQDQRALEVIQEGLTHHPEDVNLKLHQALTLGTLGNGGEEVRLLGKLAEERDRDVEIRYSLAQAMLRAGQAKESEEEMRAALNVAVDDLKRHKALHKVSEANLQSLPERVRNELEGLKFRAGNAAYYLALLLGLRKETKEREQLLKLGRDLGFPTQGYDHDLRSLGGS